MSFAHAEIEWKVTFPASNRMFLSHPDKNVFVLITRFESSISDETFDEYLASEFPDAVHSSRKEFLISQNDHYNNLSTGTSTLKGHRYGATSFNSFSERIWSDKGTLWHVAMVNHDRFEQHALMNEIMDGLLVPVKTSFMGSIIPSAYASSSDEDCYDKLDKNYKELGKIVGQIQKKNCDIKGIHPKKNSGKYGLKFTAAGFSSCLKGSGDAIRSMKNGFLSSMGEWQEKTGQQIKSLNCVEPKQPSGFWAQIGYSQQMQNYQYCLTAASTSAGIGMVADSVTQTAKSLKALYQWVKAEENPLGVITSIVASKYDGFMCLTSEAQQEAICEFSTHFVAALAATAAGAGSVAAIAKGLKAARSVAALAPVMSKSPAVIRALQDAKKSINGVSPAFIKAEPFTVSVAKGQAEAAKVIESLKKGAILEKSPAEMDKILKAKGFERIDTCIKMKGECVKHINMKTGKEEIAPMVVYVHPSGLAARIKPHGDSTSKFRPKPHGSFMLVDPENKKLAEGIKALKSKKTDSETFMNTFLSWEKEQAKVDMRSGKPLPSAPNRTNVPEELSDADKVVYNDTISNLTHFGIE